MAGPKKLALHGFGLLTRIGRQAADSNFYIVLGRCGGRCVEDKSGTGRCRCGRGGLRVMPDTFRRPGI